MNKSDLATIPQREESPLESIISKLITCAYNTTDSINNLIATLESPKNSPIDDAISTQPNPVTLTEKLEIIYSVFARNDDNIIHLNSKLRDILGDEKIL